jgi:hypothetical protein
MLLREYECDRHPSDDVCEYNELSIVFFSGSKNFFSHFKISEIGVRIQNLTALKIDVEKLYCTPKAQGKQPP